MKEAGPTLAEAETHGPVPFRPPSRARRAGKRWIALSHVPLIMSAGVFMVPIYWMVISALKSNDQIFSYPLQLLPDPVHWSNFRDVWTYPEFPYLLFLWNSVFYSGMVAIGTVLSCSVVAYGFASLRFRGRTVLFYVTLSTMMIPPIVTFIPVYVMFSKAGLTGTYAPLIIPYFFGQALFIFMMRQFFLGIPRDLFDAARMDGASEFRIFWQIALPLVRPAIMVAIVFSVMYSWHDFFGPLIYIQAREKYPLSLGLFVFRGERTAEWGLAMTGSLLTALPLVILFLLTQRYFVRGVTMTGIK